MCFQGTNSLKIGPLFLRLGDFGSYALSFWKGETQACLLPERQPGWEFPWGSGDSWENGFVRVSKIWEFLTQPHPNFILTDTLHHQDASSPSLSPLSVHCPSGCIIKMEKDCSEWLSSCFSFLLQVSDNRRDSTVFWDLLRHQTIWFYIKDRELAPKAWEHPRITGFYSSQNLLMLNRVGESY